MSGASAAAWAAEQELLDHAVRTDPRRLDRLLAPEFREIGASGDLITRQQTVDALIAETAPIVYDADEVHADIPAVGLVLLTYRLTTATRVTRRSSLWRVDGAGVRLVFHQGTVVG